MMNAITAPSTSACALFDKVAGTINWLLGPKTVVLKDAFGLSVDRILQQEKLCQSNEIPLECKSILAREIALASRLLDEINMGRETITYPRGQTLETALLGDSVKRSKPCCGEDVDRICRAALRLQ